MANNPLRIAQVIGKANLSGVDTVVMEYYRHIDRTRVQFDFIIDGYDVTPLDEEIKELGGRVYKTEAYEQSMVKCLKQWRTIFLENRYMIVHSHLNTLGAFPLYAAWRAGVPVRIAHNHSTAAPGEGKRTLLKYILRPTAKFFATHYAACSDLAGKWLFGESVYNSGSVRLIKNAIDIGKFSYNEQTRERLRQELGLNGKFVIGHVGRFVYQKNHDFLVEIFQEIYKYRKDSTLMLIGSGELEQVIKQKVEAFGLKDSVLFMGTRADVADLMQAMDVLAFPSHYEGLGMAVIEAQAAGLHIVASKAVPEEAKVSELLEYCQLSQPASVWAEKVLDVPEFVVHDRCGQNEKIRTAGYDIIEEANELQSWYEDVGK